MSEHDEDQPTTAVPPSCHVAARPSDGPDPDLADPIVVGIGASAGGPSALKRLIAAIQRDSDMAFVFTTDSEGHVEMTVGKIQSLLGVESGNVIGTVMWPEIIHAADRDHVMGEWSRARANGEEFEARYRIASSGCWVLVRAVPIRDDEGRLVQWFGTIADVHALTTTELALAEVNETLEQRVQEGTERARLLASSLSRAEQDERRRLSNVLHDDLQQVLYSLQLKLSAAREMLASGATAEAENRISDMEERLQSAIEITRSLTIDLSPPLLNGDDLDDTLQWLVSYMAQLHELHVTVEVEPTIDVDDDLRVMLFHIARELLFNVAKHAGVDTATVRVGRADRDLVLTVRDRGRGFDVGAGAPSEGVGLRHVRERLQLLAGHLDIESGPGDGATVSVRVPLRERDRNPRC